MKTFLRLDRMLVSRGPHVLYDETFHAGVNIIHGSNGSGKSTLADFIFFGLGGDLKDWKQSASRAETVRLQITTPAGILTLERTVSTDGGRPMRIYFGPMDAALVAPQDQWQQLPYRRPDSGYSFSQVLFRAIGLPEAISEGASNITMHQILRLLYVDQLTPVQRIFRVENFDTWQTRQAVGDLLAGIGGYDLFDRQLSLREVEKKYEAAAVEYRNLVAVASGYGENILAEHIAAEIQNLGKERHSLLESLNELVAAAEPTHNPDVDRIRAEAVRDYQQARKIVSQLENEIETLVYEIEDAGAFIRHLEESLADFDAASSTFFALGRMDFEYCPSCFAPIQERDSKNCQLCNTPHVPEGEDSRALAVKLDLQMQRRESISLQEERRINLAAKQSTLRIARTALKRATATLDLARSTSASGREGAVAEVSRKIGFIDSQLEALQKRLELSNRIRAASDAKETLNQEVTHLKQEIEAITLGQASRKARAYSRISAETKALLDQDLEEHSDFGDVTHVNFDFGGDWVAINGDKNRAGSASGMVILKNSFAAGFLISAIHHESFNLPRWMLFDNVEDKGMVEERSWNFQRLLVAASSAAKQKHQIIFTTSKIAPELDTAEYVIGRKYTREGRSLN